MAFPYKLYGGAQRPDAISGLAPQFSEALLRLYAAAPPEVQAELGLNSAYRSPERQKELWDASDKSGKMVAAPGKSRHNHGDAVDLYGFGLGGGKTGLVSQATRDWVKANAAAHGFYFPMDYEPWHMQLKAENTQGPPMPAAQMNYTPEQRRKAIAAIESAGSGDYNALGVWTGDPKDGRDRAYGRYQIMGKNIPAWSKEVLGREVTPEEFMRDPKIQDAIFDKKFGDFVAKHGERGAASMWFTGSPNFDADKTDALGTTVKSYATRYLEGLGAPLDVGDKYPVQSPAQSPTQSPIESPLVAKTTEEPKDKIAAGFADIAKNAGGMFGASTGEGFKQMPIAKAPAPLSTMMQAQPANILNPQAGDMQRQQLALAMARLNSGKLWV